MRRLAAIAGVDYGQWRALVKTSLKLDLRQTSLGKSSASGGTTAATLILMQVLVYTLLGLAIAAFIWTNPDLFSSALIGMTYVMFMVGSAVLLDHNSAITSPEDYAILGFRPIGSRTYFAARLTNVLVYTLAIATCVTAIPATALFIRHGARVGLAGIAAFYGSAIGVTLVILFSYAWMLRTVGPSAIKRALSYVQILMSFAVYGGYFVIQIVAKASAIGFTAPKTIWTMLFPPAWFASYVEIAAGRGGWLEIAAALASLIAIGGMIASLGGRLSMGYAERLGALTAAARSPAASANGRRPGWWFRTGEARAVAILIRSQFRNDQKFRLAVLGFLPLTVLYILMSIRDGSIVDPFEVTPGTRYSLVIVAVMMFPSTLKLSLTNSDSFRASWIFFASPADRMRILRASKNVLVVLFLIPYLLLVAGVYAWFIDSLPHVLVHMAMLGFMSHLVLQMVVLIDPALPFSRPVQKGRGSTTLVAFMIGVAIVSSVFQVTATYLYRSTVATMAAFAVLAMSGFVLDQLTRARVEHETRSLEFLG